MSDRKELKLIVSKKRAKVASYLDPGILLLLGVGVHEEGALLGHDGEGVLLFLVLAANRALPAQLDNTCQIGILSKMNPRGEQAFTKR